MADDNNILSYGLIRNKTRETWNKKTSAERLRNGCKYKHIFTKYGFSCHDWANDFDGLSKRQKNILFKGELIRTYDKLTNKEKTVIKEKFNLGTFSSKWFKMPSQDKKKLLQSILCNAEREKGT